MEKTTYLRDSNISYIKPCIRDYSTVIELSTIYYFMFVFSLFGNGLILVIIHRFERLTTVTNILLVNLVASSLIFMSSLPFLGVYTHLSSWIFGSFMCKIVFSAYYMGFYSSVWFLTLLMFHRYLTVVYSVPAAQVRNQRYTIISCAVVWLVAGLACIRPMIHHINFSFLGTGYCENFEGDGSGFLVIAGLYIQLFIFLILPLAVIIYCYIRIIIAVISSETDTKFKKGRLISIIILLFFICWTPFNVAELMQHENNDCEVIKKREYALRIIRNMACCYFCISPILYTPLW